IVIRRDGSEGDGAAPVVRQFTLRRDGTAPMPAPAPRVRQFQFHGDPSDPEFQKRMEQFEREMEQWGEEYGRTMEEWGREFGEQQGARARALAMIAPEVIQDCREGEQRRTTTAEGRTRIVICQRDVVRSARTGLRQAREAIARNSAISEDVRR